jgi:hypothetical protein
MMVPPQGNLVSGERPGTARRFKSTGTKCQLTAFQCQTPERNATKIKILAVAIAATAFATPALADFFIVREGPSGPCRVVETRPKQPNLVVASNKAYKMRDEAEKELAVVCK